MAFYVKLGALFVKQVSKPLASQLKKTAVAHPVLQGYLTRFGQRMHEWNTNMTQKLKSEGELAGRKARAVLVCACVHVECPPRAALLPGVCYETGRRRGTEEGGRLHGRSIHLLGSSVAQALRRHFVLAHANSSPPPNQVAGIAVVYEVNLSKAKDDAKAAATRAEKEQLRAAFVEIKDALHDTIRSVEALDARLEAVEQAAAARQQSRWWPRALGGGGSAWQQAPLR